MRKFYHDAKKTLFRDVNLTLKVIYTVAGVRHVYALGLIRQYIPATRQNVAVTPTMLSRLDYSSHPTTHIQSILSGQNASHS
jgi:hypothetical protein